VWESWGTSSSAILRFVPEAEDEVWLLLCFPIARRVVEGKGRGEAGVAGRR
jgi:hypothetical protein